MQRSAEDDEEVGGFSSLGLEPNTPPMKAHAPSVAVINDASNETGGERYDFFAKSISAVFSDTSRAGSSPSLLMLRVASSEAVQRDKPRV